QGGCRRDPRPSLPGFREGIVKAAWVLFNEMGRGRPAQTRTLMSLWRMSPENPPGRSRLPETPWDALGPVVREQVIVEGQTFVILRPDESDQLLDHPAVR